MVDGEKKVFKSVLLYTKKKKKTSLREGREWGGGYGSSMEVLSVTFAEIWPQVVCNVCARCGWCCAVSKKLKKNPPQRSFWTYEEQEGLWKRQG